MRCSKTSTISLMLCLLFSSVSHAENLLLKPTMWPMYQGDSQHDGYVPITLDPNFFHLRWQKKIIDAIDMQAPATSYDKLFITTQTNEQTHPYALITVNTYDGKILWKNTLNITYLSAPSYADGQVFAEASGLLYAYDASTGQHIFQSSFDSQFNRFLAPTLFQQHIYMNGGYYGGVYSFDQLTGKQDWFQNLAQFDGWTPAVNDKYVIACIGGYLNVLDRLTGTRLFNIKDPNYNDSGYTINTAPTLDENNNYVLCIESGYLTVFDLATQAVKYSIGPGFTGQPALANGVIYAVLNNNLAAIDELTHQVKWLWSVNEGALLKQPIVTDNLVFIASAKATYAVSTDTHKTLWQDSVSGKLAIGDSTLFIVSDDGTVTAMSLM